MLACLISNLTENGLDRLVQIGSEMKLVTFTAGSADRAGVADPENGTVRDVTDVLGGADVAAAIGRWDSYQAALADALPSLPAVPLDSVRLRAPLRPARDVFAVGKNYRE